MHQALALALALLAAAPCSSADIYPAKSVRVLVPSGTGNATDLTARVISHQLADQLGVPFVVENRAGASGSIASGLAAKAPADGHTLLLTDTAWTILPSLNKSLPYDVRKDFVPITQLNRLPEALVVSSALKVNTLREFIELAQANPGKFNYGSTGAGGVLHLFAELFKRRARVDIVHVPYSGGAGEAITALLGGQIQMQFATIPAVMQHVRSGQLRALAVTTDGKRSAALPEVPAMAEAGLAGMEVYIWYGLVAPAGTAAEQVNKMHGEAVKALAAQPVRNRFAALDVELVGSSPGEFSNHIRSELQRWAEVVRTAGVTTD